MLGTAEAEASQPFLALEEPWVEGVSLGVVIHILMQKGKVVGGGGNPYL